MNSKEIAIYLSILFTLISFNFDYFSICAILLFSINFFRLIINSNRVIAFREFVLVLFNLNYLLSPAIMYNGLDQFQTIYAMSIPKEQFFSLAIPAAICFQIGLYAIPAKILSNDLALFKIEAGVNETTLKRWAIVGIVLKLISIALPGEIAFFVYLLSCIRFVGAFGLAAVNLRKYWIFLAVVFVFETAGALAQGMFHDTIMWLIFFGLFASKLYKPPLLIKGVIVIIAITLIFVLQLTKGDYRSRTWSGEEESGLNSFSTSLTNSTQNKDEVLSPGSISNSLTRVNQGWIFASTVSNLENTQDFQQWSLLNSYLEAAILPRFLAPNKLTAGNRETFNRYSGKFISEGTSMALGLLADGFISFKFTGVYLFALGFGLTFGLIFKIVENWTRFSPLFLLFIFPILIYPVRPDCETQTVLGHIVKSLFVFGCLVLYYKEVFLKKASSYTLN